MQPPALHQSVLLEESVSLLAPRAGETVLDVTLGLGGHAQKLGERIGPDGTLIGLDADEQNLAAAGDRLAALPCKRDLRHANFRDLSSFDLPPVDVLFADLGLSSPHVDDPSRGFTFRVDAPLDLRFDRSTGFPAAEWIRRASSGDLLRVLQEYGELPFARRLAGKLQEGECATTADVRRAAEAVYGWRAPSVLPQIFQALRIAVNDELGALSALLSFGPTLLAPGGRMGVISYHSLEDRLVKQAFRTLTTAPVHPDTGQDLHPAAFIALTRKSVVPSEDERHRNPRSRSAKLRAIMRRAPALS